MNVLILVYDCVMVQGMGVPGMFSELCCIDSEKPSLWFCPGSLFIWPGSELLKKRCWLGDEEGPSVQIMNGFNPD